MAIEEPSAEKPAVGAGTAAPAPDATVTASGHDQPVASAKATEDAGPASDQTQSEESIVEPDLNYESALASAGISTFGWLTDFSKHTVTYDEIVSGGPPRDGIPPLDDPKFVTPAAASEWLDDLEPVLAFELNDDARAYPLQIMMWHEIVNDVVGGVPVAATFCPLCNSAIVFDRRLDGVVHDFGTSGKLRNSDLIMWDRQTETWWQQFTGEGIVGELAGKRLRMLSASLIAYRDFKKAYPGGKILSKETGFARRYGDNPYVGYDRIDNPPFLFNGPLNGKLLPMERVAALTVAGVDAAFPFSVLEGETVINYAVNGRDLAVFYKPGTLSALDNRAIKQSKDIGSTGIFEANVDGRALTFRADGDRILDNETGSVWNILGKAIDGPLNGTKLKPLVHGNHFWFAWGAFKPDTLIYQSIG